MADPFISVTRNFISPQECAAILDHADDSAPWNTDVPQSDIWYNRYMHFWDMPEALRTLVGQVRPRIKQAIVDAYGITDPLYADTLQVVRWRPGDEQHPHADAQNPDGSPHPFAWRAFASILYLNDTFEGGEIYFPDHGLTPAIEPGTLAFFPGTTDFMHGVNKVRSGTRFTMASFFTFDESKYDGAPI